MADSPSDAARLVQDAQQLARIAMEPALYYDSDGESLGVVPLRSLQTILSALQQAQARPEVEIDCPACGETVKQVASATLSLALWQHWNWTCPKREQAQAPASDLKELVDRWSNRASDFGYYGQPFHPRAEAFKECAGELAAALVEQGRHLEIDCPLCGETVKQVASATLSLALWQHVNWTCAKQAQARPEIETVRLREMASQLESVFWCIPTTESNARQTVRVMADELKQYAAALPLERGESSRQPEGSFGYCAGCYHPLDRCSHCDVGERGEQAAAPQWQPIETAPKGDGVIVYWPAYSQRPVSAIQLQDGRWLSSGNEPKARPTHWQPMPPPPARADKE